MIENSKTYQRLCNRVHSTTHELKANIKEQVQVINEKLQNSLEGAEASMSATAASPVRAVKLASSMLHLLTLAGRSTHPRAGCTGCR